ncbi:Rpn family recombination-promoting nuclease/putative transposase [Bernardetia sp. OM2101]|uniref:Rpn family recombination-promoting nuclease/putative transposase n=1 Tax=Bernardetia sp. OM2101 TaxID=3344876 RepID=UPI0035D036C7
MSTQEKYLNPFTDFGFKKLFGTEVNKDLLIHFLNSVLPDNVKISTLTYLKNEHVGHSAMDRKVIYDLYCENEKGEKFIVELQKARQKYFKERTIFYSTFPIQEQSKQGDWDFGLNAVYSVSILNFLIGDNSYATKQKKIKEKASVKTIAKLMNIDTKEVFYDKLTYVQIHIPLFDKKESELETFEDKWFYVIQNLQRFQNRPEALQERIFDKLFKTAELAKFDKKQRMAYEDSLKYYRDIRNVENTAEERGKEEGKIEGKKERTIEIAKQALAEGASVNFVCKITKLSIEDVQKIINSLKKE